MNIEPKTHYLYTLKELGDQRGGLIVVNSEAEIPFIIKRVFYNYKTSEDAIRGGHANISSSFVMVSVNGSCVVEVDEGGMTKEYLLDSPEKALFIGKGLWKSMRGFSADNVLLVFSDNPYDANEYIQSYEDYINFC